MSISFSVSPTACHRTPEACREHRRITPPDERLGLWGSSPCQNCKRGIEYERQAAALIPCERCRMCGIGFPDTYDSGRKHKIPEVYHKHGVCYDCFQEYIWSKTRRQTRITPGRELQIRIARWKKSSCSGWNS